MVTSLAYAPGGRLLASASWDGTARLWQVTGGRALWPLSVLHGHTRFVRCVAFSPDARILVTASEDATVRVWDLTDPRKPRLASVLAPGAGEVGGAGFAANGRLRAVWALGAAGLWDLTDPANPRRLSRIAEDGPDVTMASFRPDGRTPLLLPLRPADPERWLRDDPRAFDVRSPPGPARSRADGSGVPADRGA